MRTTRGGLFGKSPLFVISLIVSVLLGVGVLFSAVVLLIRGPSLSSYQNKLRTILTRSSGWDEVEIGESGPRCLLGGSVYYAFARKNGWLFSGTVDQLTSPVDVFEVEMQVSDRRNTAIETTFHNLFDDNCLSVTERTSGKGGGQWCYAEMVPGLGWRMVSWSEQGDSRTMKDEDFPSDGIAISPPITPEDLERARSLAQQFIAALKEAGK